MRDVDEGAARVDVQALQLGAHLEPELGVEVRERLVHEEHSRLGRERAGDGHALLLAAGELRGVAVHEHAYLDYARHAADGEVDLLRRQLADAGEHLAVLDVGEVLVEGAALGGALGALGLEGLFALGEARGGDGAGLERFVQLPAHYGLGRENGDLEAVDELHVGLVHVQLALFVDALLDDAHRLVGPFQHLDELRGLFGLEVYAGQLVLDVGEAEGDVLVDGHVRPEGVVLEEEAHLALVGGDVYALLAVEHHAVADGDASAGGGLETGYHAQRSGLAAAGGPEQRDKGVVVDDEVQIVDGVEFVPALCDVGEYYLGHCLTSYPFVQTGAGHLVDEGVADQNGDDEYQIYAA